jgi:hypothetical protein
MATGMVRITAAAFSPGAGGMKISGKLAESIEETPSAAASPNNLLIDFSA